MPIARIYQRPKNAMQSGRANTDRWVLEFEPAEAKQPDPLTGWAGSGDTREQVKLSFPSVAAAQAYAEREGLAFTVIPAPTRTLKLQTYADNFK
ncbi:ETC complex I subunit [Sphingomonas sp. RT2P30]|uniref:ETC complex I subunit n=1 Tax=Parasphingomonas halimpatiens TaxID=3096162 RepID=UPI002FCC2E45